MLLIRGCAINKYGKQLNDAGHTITEWTIHPVKENTMQAMLVSVILFGVAYAMAMLTGNLLWTLFYLTIFLFSLHRYFFPTTYRLSEESLTIERPWRQQIYPLEEFRSFTATRNGVQLNRLEHDSLYDRLRGVFIITGQEHENVVNRLRTQLKEADQS